MAALPAEDYARLLPDLELIPMPLGWAVYESGGHLNYLYFPTTSIVSLLYVMESGASAEIAITGNEGLVGISLFMGGESTPSRAVVQSAGNGYRLKASVLKKEFALGGRLQHLALRYTQALITQMAQTAVCNRHHALDQQLCRWLLLSLDRLPGNELLMTQELIANMLGVRREGVTEAAGKLQAEGRIDSLQPRPHHGTGPSEAGTPGMRVLRSGEEGSTTACCRINSPSDRASSAGGRLRPAGPRDDDLQGL